MRRTVAATLVVFLTSGLIAQEPETLPTPARAMRTASVARLANAEDVRRQLGLVPGYAELPAVADLKIAVLDYGFDGLGTGRHYLPDNTVVVEHYDPEFVRRFKLGDPEYRKSFAPLNTHGRMMAQIIWGVTGSHPQGPKFYLLNANGPTMLRRAVRYAIEAKVDIVLFCGTFEGGGNGDGRGPINRAVADALAADILWINAAGNYGSHVYEGPVEVLSSGYLRLGHGSDDTALRFRNLLDENTLTITLNWNDYREEEDAGTDKDLDLYVEDWLGWVIGSSEKRQVSGADKNVAEESRNPRERIVLTDLAADHDRDYLIRVKAKSRNFTPADRVRVLITASREGFLDPQTGAPTDAVQFLDASKRSEIFPPADNPLVITVGDPSPNSSVGPTADHRRKPDIILVDSGAAFSNGELTAGASNAAAYFAGVVALMKAAEPGLRTRHLLWMAHQDKTTSMPIDGADTTAGRPPVRRRLEDLGLGRGQSSASLRTIYGPLRARAGGSLLTLSPPASSGRGAVRLSASPQSTSARPAEVLRVPPHEVIQTAPQPTGARRIWRTPTREHLADVVRDKH
jgi:hypothetical protein